MALYEAQIIIQITALNKQIDTAKAHKGGRKAVAVLNNKIISAKH
jgi:hypothetical protein